MAPFQQLNLIKCSRFQPPCRISRPLFPLKLLFVQPSVQAAQTQMEADDMDDPTGAHTKAKHNEAQIIDRKNTTTPTASKACGYFRAMLS